MGINLLVKRKPTRMIRYLRAGVKASDTALQSLGELGIMGSDLVGGATLTVLCAPAKLNTPKVRRTIGGGILIGSALTGIHNLLERPHGVERKPLAIQSLGVTSTGVTLNYLMAKAMNEAHAAQPSVQDGPEMEVPPDVLAHGAGVITETTDPTTIVRIENFDPSTQSAVATVTASPVMGPSDLLLAEMQADKTPMKGLGEKELTHLRSIVNYEGSTNFRQAIMNMAGSSQWKFYNLLAEYNRLTGEMINLKSAWRSKTKQAQLAKTMPKGMAAGMCGSPHAIAAEDIDREGMASKQVAKMQKLKLLQKHGLWVPPEVGEAWHIEDPAKVYFRYLPRKDPGRNVYSTYVCSGLTGIEHDAARLKDGIFTVADTYARINTTVDELFASRQIKGEMAALLKEYFLLSVRSESLYGRQMISKTGAKGWWQFTGPTAKQYNLKYPMQLKESARATLDFAVDNMVGLSKRGIPITVKNIYFSHMIGLHGLEIALEAHEGKTLDRSDLEVFEKVVGPNLDKTTFAKFFDGSVKDPELKPGVAPTEVASAYFAFFDKRFAVYYADNAFLHKIVYG